jgi:hypothetical protein
MVLFVRGMPRLSTGTPDCDGRDAAAGGACRTTDKPIKDLQQEEGGPW